jgi:hypothetical protein
MNAKEFEIYQAEKTHSFWSGFAIGVALAALLIGIIHILIYLGI